MGNPFKFLVKPVTALAGKVDSSIEQKMLMSVIRHVATMAGTALAAHGVIASDDTSVVAGAIVAIVSAIAGSYQKTH